MKRLTASEVSKKVEPLYKKLVEAGLPNIAETLYPDAWNERDNIDHVISVYSEFL